MVKTNAIIHYFIGSHKEAGNQTTIITSTHKTSHILNFHLQTSHLSPAAEHKIVYSYKEHNSYSTKSAIKQVLKNNLHGCCYSYSFRHQDAEEAWIQ